MSSNRFRIQADASRSSVRKNGKLEATELTAGAQGQVGKLCSSWAMFLKKGTRLCLDRPDQKFSRNTLRQTAHIASSQLHLNTNLCILCVPASPSSAAPQSSHCSAPQARDVGGDRTQRPFLLYTILDREHRFLSLENRNTSSNAIRVFSLSLSLSLV
jgi:hypothetical protein